MVDRKLPDGARELAERLRREARADRPEFSESLHARVRQAIRPMITPPARPASRSWPLSGGLSLAVAVALLVGVFFATRPTADSLGPVSNPIDPITTTAGFSDPTAPFDPNTPIDQIAESTSRTVREVGATVDSQVSAGQWGYLDHDARLAIKLLKDQLPLSVASND